MSKFSFLYLLFLGLFFVSGNSYARDNRPKQQLTVKIDSGKITPSEFDKAAIRNYAEQKEFKYDKAQAEQFSLWDRFWTWFWRMISNLFQGVTVNPISRYFFIGLGVAIAAFIIFKVIGADSIFSKKSKETILPYDILNENIHEINYEQELQRLVAEGKYRLAVRLLYLRALKKLSDAEIIQWQPDKTNYNYLMEIGQPELKSEFSQLTHQFDYIWYGDFPVDATKFEPIIQSFNHFNSQIK